MNQSLASVDGDGSSASVAGARVGINGFGRMGRLALRAAWGWPGLEFVHINELKGDAETAAHLLMFDSVHGRWPHDVRGEAGARDRREAARIHAARRPRARCRGAISGSTSCSSARASSARRDTLAPYFERGVRKVIVAAPVKEGRAQRRRRRQRRPLRARAASTCSRPPPARPTAWRPVVKVIHEGIGIRHGVITTIHDITNTQTVVDAPHKDLRRARARQPVAHPDDDGLGDGDRADLPGAERQARTASRCACRC